MSKTLSNQDAPTTPSGEQVGQRCLVRPLEVGCEVVTNGGKIHTIGKITYGDSVAESQNSFFRWEKEYPWEIEHAAMNPETDSILTVDWPNDQV